MFPADGQFRTLKIFYNRNPLHAWQGHYFENRKITVKLGKVKNYSYTGNQNQSKKKSLREKLFIHSKNKTGKTKNKSQGPHKNKQKKRLSKQGFGAE